MLPEKFRKSMMAASHSSKAGFKTHCRNSSKISKMISDWSSITIATSIHPRLIASPNWIFSSIGVQLLSLMNFAAPSMSSGLGMTICAPLGERLNQSQLPHTLNRWHSSLNS